MKKVGAELVYGLKDGNYVYVDDVENGLDCGCVCPACGKPLNAKQGQKKAHHFAHRGTNECEYVKQTNIHCMAEEIFLEEKEIFLPPIIIDEGNTYSPVFQGGKVSIDSVELEKRISDFIPDIVLQLGNATLLVEIFVTHAVDDAKKEKIRNDGRYDVIEIDLSDKVHDDITDDELRLLIKDQLRMSWIYSTSDAIYTRNIATVANTYPIATGTNMVEGCPLGILPNISRCDKCTRFLGMTASNEVICIFQFLLHATPEQKQSLPPMRNIEKQYAKMITQPVAQTIHPVFRQKIYRSGPRIEDLENRPNHAKAKSRYKPYKYSRNKRH